VTASEESRARLTDESEECAPKDGEDLSGVAVVVAWGVFGPLGVALPVVFVFDAPMTTDDLEEALRGGLERIETGDEVAHAIHGSGGVFFGALCGACNAHDRASKGQAEALGFERDYANLVIGDASMRPTFDGKRGEA